MTRGSWHERPPSADEIGDLARNGIRAFGLWLHGPSREAHDWHAGQAGAFDAALKALSVARAHGMKLAVASAITRSNARVLAEVAPLLKRSGVALWMLVWAGDAAPVARLGLAIPPALAAMDRAEKLGIRAHIAGAPLCALGPFASRALDAPPRSYGASCGACAARPACPGIDADYLARFGEGEIHALSAIPARRPKHELAELAPRAWIRSSVG